ncbi:hypothetical protein QL285_072113 [Trifolium repens]|nr:hypothetical protein QL285_072113 [Trifolium repens]
MNLVNQVIIFKMTKLVRLRAQLPKMKHTPNQLLAVADSPVFLLWFIRFSGCCDCIIYAYHSQGSCSANLPPNSHPDYDDDLDDQSLELEGDT